MYLSEQKWFLIVLWVETIAGNHTCPEFLPDGVGGKTVHVHLNVRSNLLVGQELTGNDLVRTKQYVSV